MQNQIQQGLAYAFGMFCFLVVQFLKFQKSHINKGNLPITCNITPSAKYFFQKGKVKAILLISLNEPKGLTGKCMDEYNRINRYIV